MKWAYCATQGAAEARLLEMLEPLGDPDRVDGVDERHGLAEVRTYSSPSCSSSGASTPSTSGHQSGCVRGSLTTSQTSSSEASIRAW